MSHHHLRSFFLLLAVCLVCASALFAADAILIRKSGDVEIRVKGKKGFQTAEAGAELHFGDRVQTLKGAKAQIVFSDGSAILIKESTSALLQGKPGSALINIPAGEFLIGLKKKLSRGQTFRVKTPAAIASVRGTLFWGQSDQELNSTFACFQHEIQIQAKGKSILLKPGEKCFIPYGKIPGKKESANVPPEFLDSFEVDGSIEGLKDLLKEP